MSYSFHPEAEEEFSAGVSYYEECEIGLGFDFSREIHATFQNALEYPEMWPQTGLLETQTGHRQNLALHRVFAERSAGGSAVVR